MAKVFHQRPQHKKKLTGMLAVEFVWGMDGAGGPDGDEGAAPVVEVSG